MPSFIIYDKSTGQVHGSCTISNPEDLQRAILGHTTPTQRALVLSGSAPKDLAPLLVSNGAVVKRRELVTHIKGGVIQTYPSTFTGQLNVHTASGTTTTTITNGVGKVPAGALGFRVHPSHPTFFSKLVKT